MDNDDYVKQIHVSEMAPVEAQLRLYLAEISEGLNGDVMAIHLLLISAEDWIAVGILASRYVWENRIPLHKLEISEVHINKAGVTRLGMW